MIVRLPMLSAGGERVQRRAIAVAAALLVAAGPCAAQGTAASGVDAAAASNVAAASAAGNQITVKPGQSLNDIAIAVTQSHEKAVLARAARALFEANPGAFMRNDPSLLKLGATLNVPQLDATGALVGAASAGGASAPAGTAVAASGAAAAGAAGSAGSAPAVAASAASAAAHGGLAATAPAGASASASASSAAPAAASSTGAAVSAASSAGTAASVSEAATTANAPASAVAAAPAAQQANQSAVGASAAPAASAAASAAQSTVASGEHVWTGSIQATPGTGGSAPAANASAAAPGAGASQPRAQVSGLQQLLALKNRVLMELQKHGIGGKPAAAPQASGGAAAPGGQAAVLPASGASGVGAASATALVNRPAAPAATQGAAASSLMSKEGYVGVAALIGAVLAAVVAGLAMRRRKQASAPAGDERAATEATSTSAAPAPDAQQAAASAYGAMARDDDTDARGERDGRDGRAAADGLTQPTSTAPTLPATTHDAAAGEGAQRAAAARFGQPEALGQDHSSEGATAHHDEPGTPVPAAEAANAPLSLADSGPELHEPPEAAHPVAAPAHEPPTLTLELPPVASAPAPQHPFATGEPPAAIDEGEGTTEGATGFAADAESKEGLASLPDTAADASLPPDHTDATSAASVASQPFVPTEPLAGAAAAATPSDEHARAAEAPAGLDAANQPQLHPHPQPTESDPSPAIAPPFPRAALDALSSLDMALPPRAEAPAVTPPASLSTQPVVEPEVTAREAVPLHEPPAPRVADEIEAGTAGAGAIAGMGAAHYGPLTLDFDLELPSGTAVEPLPTFTPEELARIARNKLDLASEYIGLGDVAGARTLINEVIESNDAATRNDARALLSTLAPLS